MQVCTVMIEACSTLLQGRSSGPNRRHLKVPKRNPKRRSHLIVCVSLSLVLPLFSFHVMAT